MFTMIWSYNLTAIDSGQCHAGLFALSFHHRGEKQKRSKNDKVRTLCGSTAHDCIQTDAGISVVYENMKQRKCAV